MIDNNEQQEPLMHANGHPMFSQRLLEEKLEECKMLRGQVDELTRVMEDERRSERLRLVEACLPIAGRVSVDAGASMKRLIGTNDIVDVAMDMANRILAAIDNNQTAEVPK